VPVEGTLAGAGMNFARPGYKLDRRPSATLSLFLDPKLVVHDALLQPLRALQHDRTMIRSGRKAFFEPVPQSAQQVRAFVREACTAWELPSDAPVLMVDELATNAITHAHTPFWVKASMGAGGLRVEVGDGNPLVPVVTEAAPHAESGRGMQIVATLASRWGTKRCDRGKTVWFEV
jgi:hypothetical protein